MRLRAFPIALWLLITTCSCAAIAWAQSSSSQAGRADTMVINTELVSITVSVTDKKGVQFTGLNRTAFTVFEDDIAQDVTFFGADDGPASVGIVFDLSGSMAGKKSEWAKEALARFVQTGHDDDEYSLIAFNNQTQAFLERVRDGEALKRAVGNIAPNGNTALFDAAAVALQQIKQGRWEKRALIIISDGEDNRSRTTLRQLRQMILEAGVTVYAVLVEENRLPRFFGDEELQALAAHSGGRAFSPNTSEQLAETFDQITVDMRQRYSIGYTPTNVNPDGRWRRLKVKVTPPANTTSRLVIRTRAGYYAKTPGAQPKRRGIAETNACCQ